MKAPKLRSSTANVLLLWICFVGSATGTTEALKANRAYFRVVQINESGGASTSGELELTEAGVLRFSSEANGREFVIERSRDMSSWIPFTRGTTKSGLNEVKVEEFEERPGMVFIPGGRFNMGDVLGDLNNATPVHEVTVSAFMMKQQETTIAEAAEAFSWALERGKVRIAADGNAVIDASGEVLMELQRFNSQIVYTNNKLVAKSGQELFPANYLSWFGAVSLCNFFGEMGGLDTCYNLETWECNFGIRGFRLPTEAEWEWAARSGREGGRFPWIESDTITQERANYRAGPRPGQTVAPPYDLNPTVGFHPDFAQLKPSSSPVGTFEASPYGLYDMCGNVWEWVWDWAARYPSQPSINPTGPSSGTYRVFRGGAWFTTAERTTVASRYTSASPQGGVVDVGFRYVLPTAP